MSETVVVRLRGALWESPDGALTLTVPGKKQDRSRRLVMPWIPDEIERSGIARVWQQVDRPGRDPLSYTSGGSLRRLTFTVELSGPNSDQPVTRLVDDLERAADEGLVVTAALGARMLGLFVLTGLTVTEREWDGSAEALVAVAELELTEASEIPDTVGPVPAVKAIKGKAKNMVKKGRRT